MSSTEIETNVANFFHQIEDIPNVEIVRLDLPEFTLATLTAILVENFTRNNISELLEFRVDTFTAKADRTKFFE